MDSDIKVTISGRAIYKALTNYLKSEDVVNKKIDEVVATMIADGRVNKILEAAITRKLEGQYNSTLITEGIDKHLKPKIKDQFDIQIEKAIQNRLAKAVFSA